MVQAEGGEVTNGAKAGWLGEFLKATGLPGVSALTGLGGVALLLLAAYYVLPWLNERVSAVDSRTKATYTSTKELKGELGFLEQTISGQIETEGNESEQRDNDQLGAIRLGFGRLDRTLTQIDISLREQNRLFLVLCHQASKSAADHRRCDGEQ